MVIRFRPWRLTNQLLSGTSPSVLMLTARPGVRRRFADVDRIIRIDPQGVVVVEGLRRRD
jgi:hypothetical protein